MTAETVVVENRGLAIIVSRARLKTVFESENVARSLGNKLLFFLTIFAIGYVINSACGKWFCLKRDCSGQAVPLFAIAGIKEAIPIAGECDAMASGCLRAQINT